MPLEAPCVFLSADSSSEKNASFPPSPANARLTLIENVFVALPELTHFGQSNRTLKGPAWVNSSQIVYWSQDTLNIMICLILKLLINSCNLSLHWQPARFGARSCLTVTWRLVAVKGTEQHRKHRVDRQKIRIFWQIPERKDITTQYQLNVPCRDHCGQVVVLDRTVPCTLSPLGVEIETKAKTQKTMSCLRELWI